METQNAPTPATHEAAPPQPVRIAFERLRERTDELELLVSGLFAFSLLTLPGPILDAYLRASMHVDGLFDYVLHYGYLITAGVCYALAVAFIAHLAIRAYWVGAIGLKSTFPDGIRWDRVPLMGPVTRPFYQRTIGSLGGAIERADRAASILFAYATLIGVVVLWTGILLVATLAIGWLAGSAFSDSERAALIVFGAINLLLMAITLTPSVLDRVVAWREARGQASPRLRRLAESILRLVGRLVPQRLIYVVQYTLHSNLPNRGFMAFYIGGVALSFAASTWMLAGSTQLGLVDSYRVLSEEAVDHGLLGAHYESMRERGDRLPMIPSDRVADTYLRLFIPHQPRRDNPLAAQRCEGLDAGRNRGRGHEAAALARACLARLWTLSVDGQPVPLDNFVPTERRDLGMRGLMGYLEVAQLGTGLHRLELVWNAEGDDSGELRRREYVIPFWFTPAAPAPPVGPH